MSMRLVSYYWNEKSKGKTATELVMLYVRADNNGEKRSSPRACSEAELTHVMASSLTNLSLSTLKIL